MGNDLMTYLEGRDVQGFESEPRYSPDGDFLTLHLEDVDYFAQRVDDLLTVYLADDNKRLVGCKIKGVRRILDTLGQFGVSIEDGALKLSFFFLPGIDRMEPSRRRWYEELGQRTRGLSVDPAELRPAA